MQTPKLNVGEWVMGMKYSGFTRIVQYLPNRLVYRLIQQSDPAGYVPIGQLGD